MTDSPSAAVLLQLSVVGAAGLLLLQLELVAPAN